MCNRGQEDDFEACTWLRKAWHVTCAHGSFWRWYSDILSSSPHRSLTNQQGKTTLLDVLAQRKNAGTISGACLLIVISCCMFTSLVPGKILVDGKEPDSAYRRLIGYVEQTDIHYPHQVKFKINKYPF